MNKLAINGGPKTRVKPMPAREAFGKEEVSNLNQVINYYRNLKVDPPYSGKFEEKFCKEFVAYMGGKGYADAVTSGTAVDTSLQALNLKKGSEVLITAVTDCGPLNCIIQLESNSKITDTAKILTILVLETYSVQFQIKQNVLLLHMQPVSQFMILINFKNF